MLLEKALAKLCGAYGAMPGSPLEIMEMIYCGAIQKTVLGDLRDLRALYEAVIKGLSREGLLIFVAKDDKKVRQYGINPGQIYQIVFAVLK